VSAISYSLVHVFGTTSNTNRCPGVRLARLQPAATISASV
jgi:hypothetical protein